jgi:predicted unusual protein kinase regulating ubiquinone biosynthesis (AarF/ABC1/UbiB family)
VTRKPPEADGITTGRIARAAPVAGMAARATGEAVIARLRRGDGDRVTDAYARRADRYVEVMGRSKGALMKAGQMLSFVPLGAAVPAENRRIYQAAMSRLQADAPPMAPELTAAVIERELGAPADEVFAHFEPLPFAAASIGQVHRARLHDGTKVAVKVQYPGVAEAIRADLKNAELLAVFFQLLRSAVPGFTRIDPRAVAAEISERITEELDYQLEASRQRQFASAYRGHPFIRVPQVFEALSTRRVLTQQLAEGLRWSEALMADSDLRDAWGEAIFRFVFGSMRRLGLFNADPHPGNYLFHDDGSVSFLDFGCVKLFDARQIAYFRRVVCATVDGNALGLWQALAEAGLFDAKHAPDPQDVLDWQRHSLRMLLDPQPATVTPESVAESIELAWSPTGPSGRVVRSLTSPPDYVFLSRIDLGVMSVLGELRATAAWRAIQAEMDLGAPPATSMGEADAAFWAAAAKPPIRA